MLAALALRSALASVAIAAPTAKLHVSLHPARAGASTTLRFAFQISAAEGPLPPALTRMRVQLPRGIGIDMRGVKDCARIGALSSHGPQACPKDAQVGEGVVQVRVPLGEVTRSESARLTVFRGPRAHGRETLVFCALGRVPIATILVFTASIDPGRAGPLIEARIPVEQTLPGSDAAIVGMRASLGTRGRRYRPATHARRKASEPHGITLPARCPPAGLPFAADFAFNDGGSARAAATVSCRG